MSPGKAASFTKISACDTRRAAGKQLVRIPSREPRKAAQPPAPVPVQHSSTYLVRGDQPAVRTQHAGCAHSQRLRQPALSNTLAVRTHKDRNSQR